MLPTRDKASRAHPVIEAKQICHTVLMERGEPESIDNILELRLSGTATVADAEFVHERHNRRNLFLGAISLRC